MKIAVLIYLLFPAIVLASDLSDSNRLFDFAEDNYPQFFPLPGTSTFRIAGYLARYYADTDNYIGTKDGRAYVYGEIFQGLRNVGHISDYVELDVDGDELLAQLFASGISDVQVQGKGIVVAILPDDLQGSRHQRFIVLLASGQTLLIAHNIDLAPRIDDLSLNDEVEFFGEYEWNDQGGVIHWTHYDPEGNHVDGWILHNDIFYQSL